MRIGFGPGPLAAWPSRFSLGARGLGRRTDGAGFARRALAVSLFAALVAAVQAGPPKPGPAAFGSSPIAAGEHTDCTPTAASLVLDGGYEVSLCYQTADGVVGEGRGGLWASGQAGLLWFFDRGNAEILVKVLDGCSLNGRRWVYVAPVTDVAFNLHVTSRYGRQWTHRNQLGATAVARSDNAAFVCATDDAASAAASAPADGGGRTQRGPLRAGEQANAAAGADDGWRGRRARVRADAATGAAAGGDDGWRERQVRERAVGVARAADSSRDRRGRQGEWGSDSAAGSGAAVAANALSDGPPSAGRLSATGRGQAPGVAAGAVGAPAAESRGVAGSPVAAGEYSDCTPASTPLVFDGGYAVSLCYETADGVVGEGRAGIWASGQSGLLWFFDRDNAEALVKVLDGCSLNGHRWVFVAPVTDLAFNLHVTSRGGRQWTHRNRLGATAAARSDVAAFDCAADDAKASVQVTPGELTFTAPGETAQLSAMVWDEYGRFVEDADVLWSTAQQAVARVNATGLVEAVGVGVTTVRAQWGSLTGEATVGFRGSPRVDVSSGIGVLTSGDTLRLSAEAFDEYGMAVSGVTFRWSSSRNAVATVDGSGLVRGAALGKTRIRATVVSGDLQRLSGTSEIAVVTGDAHDRAVLGAFYQATGGPNWRRRDGWLTSAPLGNWYGVKTDGSGRVVEIDLGAGWDPVVRRSYGHRTGLTGSIPPEIGGLANLRVLNLRVNNLAGTIPPELGRLANLRVLDLSSNDLVGPLPPELGDLANLRVLQLSFNSLGSIPPELGRLRRLETLVLSGNGLRGSVPPELGRLARLRTLNLSLNDLRGSIGGFLRGLENVRELNLWWNDFDELEPAAFAGLRNLDVLDLRDNPGAPFRLTLRPERLDDPDLLAPGPARIRYALPESAPFRMGFQLAVAGGELSADKLAIGVGSTHSAVVTVTRDADSAGGTQVTAMAVPPLPESFFGIEVAVEPAVLFPVNEPTVAFTTRTAAAPEGGTALLRVGLSEPAASAVTFGYSLGVDADPATADASAADDFHELTGSVHVAAGASSADIEFRIIDDDDLEPAREVLTVTLAPPGVETGYRRGYPHQATVVIKEGVCDRTPALRDEILDSYNTYSQRDDVDCTEMDEHRLADVRGMQLVGPGRYNQEQRGFHPSPELVARMRAGECDVEGLLPDSTRGPWEACGESSPDFRRSRSHARGSVVTKLREGDLADLPNLEILWLWGVGLTELQPEAFAGLGNLWELVLQDNELVSLPGGVFQGLDLRTSLDLGGNGFTSLPETLFANLSTLRSLSLNGNELTALPPGLVSGLSDLRRLSLAGNRLQALPSELLSDLSRLDFLDLRFNELTALPPDVFAGLSRLTWLDLDRNSLTTLSSDVFADLSSLELLALQRNQLTAVPTPAFRGLPRLEYLYIWGNPLGRLETSAFAGLTSLRRLSMGEAGIRRISPGAFSGMEHLEILLMRRNELETIPPGAFVGRHRLQLLRLDENPGAPFPFTLKLLRTDASDLRAPGPARLVLALDEGAPMDISMPLSANGGSLSADVVTIAAGRTRSSVVTATASGGSGSSMQVVAGPMPEFSRYFRGVYFRLADPLVLFGTPANRAPVPVYAPHLVRLRVGGPGAPVDVSVFFRDPDGDGLAYSATVDRPDVASVAVSGDRLKLAAVGSGQATVTVTAVDPGGLQAHVSLPVSVSGPSPGFFDIDLIVEGQPGPAVRTAFERAIEYWSAILAGTELPDVPLSGIFELGCIGITAKPTQPRVDDLAIVARVSSIDGARGVIARAAVCGVREGPGGLPFMGAIEFDADDAGWMTSRDLYEVILHEIGHLFGIGTLWQDFDLLRQPSVWTPGYQDTHFAGPRAIAAFDQAGGATYRNPKVPVENGLGLGSGDTHWRDLVFDHELMSPTQNIGVVDPLSAVTIQSLADLGYTVDVGLAEAYSLPGTVGAQESAESAERIRYGDDTPRAPIIVVGPSGRIVGRIPK